MGFEQCYSCFWWENCACDGEECICNKYIGFDDPQKKYLYDMYEADCQAALATVCEKWKNLFLSEKVNEL